ncbi:dimethyl sulfoxide reductase anchor subunit family protein [Desulfitobacterium chlororespirans]|uniref:Anaerobic dimethyl sulfoxide reductase subunit C (DMSO reductase anchor subunit) n=1 Tax=Desulfitobacterium chlororespirans DSM 11544 TaxID=1121395 RepID=A0A1M7TYJ1_9FIRM|nr:DmsC/YnfH family molybdoenzyme membrane anchor subunit [Desulfitobacterium chlororespirans]SHN75842.1 anaerobic dimethyl sulfoxide reductase subunit C (DMSO reductase anchor subunit) [Desulfitobacterium chlororespirans DSM 11544]
MVQDVKLVIFSIGLQAAIGIMIAMMATVKMNGSNEYKQASVASALLGMIGFLAFAFYLGRPAFIFNAISQFSHSWLSRVLVFSLLFIGLAIIHAVVQYVNPSIKRFGWTAGVVGLIDVISMANVYMSTSRPGWQSIVPLIDFLAVTIILGVAFFLTIQSSGLAIKSQKMYGLIGLSSAVILGVVTFLNYNSFDTPNTVLLLGIHLLLFLTGAVLLFIPSLKPTKEQTGSGRMSMVYIGTAALGGGLMVSRYLFYAVLITGSGL